MQSIKEILDSFNNPVQKDEEGNEIISAEKPQKELFDTKSLEKKKLPISEKGKYMTKEYQAYGMRLAGKLGDKQRAPMYIKWAKEKPRAILEIAYSFTIDYPNAKDKSRIFMWKVKQLEKEFKEKNEAIKESTKDSK
jgi:hypothetical protein